MGITVLSASGAVACYLRTTELRGEAAWLLERAHAQAAEYASTLNSSVAERQLKDFEARRRILDRAHLWQRGQVLLILVAVISALSSYVLLVFHRLRAGVDRMVT
jgi:hypothetical protein